MPITMLYDSLKIFHIISAALLISSLTYCYHLWAQARKSTEFAMATYRIQTQTWLIILPIIILQLATGFTMISLKNEDFSQTWIIGSVVGFIIVIGSWFSFIYALSFSQPAPTNSANENSVTSKSFRRLQSIMLVICATALFTMIFLMANKIK
jgi:uncharacterized membrane protein